MKTFKCKLTKKPSFGVKFLTAKINNVKSVSCWRWKCVAGSFSFLFLGDIFCGGGVEMGAFVIPCGEPLLNFPLGSVSPR